MPVGSKHLISGFVGQGDFGLVLHPDDGGTWQLDCGWIRYWQLRGLRGRYVTIAGTRCGFEVRAVDKVGRPKA